MTRRSWFRLRWLWLNLPPRQAFEASTGKPAVKWNDRISWRMQCTSCLCGGSKRAAISMRAARSRSLLREFVLGDNCLEPRDIFQQPLAGQDQEVIAELRILEVDLQQLLIADGQHMPVLGGLDRLITKKIGGKKLT